MRGMIRDAQNVTRWGFVLCSIVIMFAIPVLAGPVTTVFPLCHTLMLSGLASLTCTNV